MSTYLTRTPSSAGNRRTFTFSTWVKLSNQGASSRALINAGADSGSNDNLYFKSNGTLAFMFATEGSGNLVTNRVFRDPSSWYHIVVAVDTTQSTASNRVKIYVNGTQETSFSTETYPSQNYDTAFNNTVNQSFGARSYSATQYFGGYLTSTVLVDGTAYTPSNFGETDSTTGEWKPKASPSGVTYGTNGFLLKFENSGNLGLDSSGNSNNLTVNGAGTNAQSTDTPENSFAIMNPLDVGNNVSNTAFSLGSLKLVKSGTTSNNGDQIVSSLGFASGKWYWEIKGVSNPDNMFWTVFNDVLGGQAPYHNNYAYSFYGDGTGSASQIYESQEGNQKGYGIDNATCFSNNDIIQMAFDCDNYRLYIGRNGQWTDDNAASGGTITSGSAFNQSTPTGYYQISTAAAQAGFYRFAVVIAGSSVAHTTEVNFGNPTFSITSGNSDANGYGNFEYAVPSGFYALCTKNINQYG